MDGFPLDVSVCNEQMVHAPYSWLTGIMHQKCQLQIKGMGAGESEADSLLGSDARADVKVAHNYLSATASPLRTSVIHKAKIAEAV